MKRIFYILLLLLALLLTACSKANTQTPTVTTDPTTASTTAPTTAPTSEPTVAPTTPAISEEDSFQKLIKDNWWYWRAIGCDFEKPEDVSLQHYFYMGYERVPSNDYAPLTDAQKIAIDAAYKSKFGKDPYTGESRLPAAEVKKGLSVLGVSLEDVKIPDDWIYDAETDSYYFWRSDAYGLTGWTVTKVEKSDGIVKVYWESPLIWNTQAQMSYPKGTKMVMTMQEKSDGSYLILSNVPLT